MIVTSEVLLLVLAGSLLRILVGINKSMTRGIPLNRKRVLLTLTISMIAGLIAVMLFDISVFENRFFIIAVAFGGVDGIEVVYRFIVKKLFGMTSSIDYDTGTVSALYHNLTPRQRKAVTYVRRYGRIRNDDYERINHVSDATATRDLEFLVSQGVMKRQGVRKGSYYELA